MRTATIAAAPVRGGKLQLIDPGPAMAVKGVEKVVKLDNAVIVVAKGYWEAITGLRALSLKYSDEGGTKFSSASIFEGYDALSKGGKPNGEEDTGDTKAALAAPGVRNAEAHFRLLYLQRKIPYADGMQLS